MDLALACSHPVLDEYLALSGHLDPSPLLSESNAADDFDLDIDDLLDDDPSIHPSRDLDSSPLANNHLLHSLSSTTVPVPAVTDMDFLTTCAADIDPGTKALHALDTALQKSGQSRSFHYAALRHDEPLLNSEAPVHAHMDEGAMASTTDRLDLLWHLRWLPTNQQHLTTLKVADNRSNHPTAVGFLQIPTTDSTGHRMVKCYYTPSLPATIISPDAMGVQFRCRGYTSISNFDGTNCCVRLCHCRRVSEDIVVPLLYTHNHCCHPLTRSISSLAPLLLLCMFVRLALSLLPVQGPALALLHRRHLLILISLKSFSTINVLVSNLMFLFLILLNLLMVSRLGLPLFLFAPVALHLTLQHILFHLLKMGRVPNLLLKPYPLHLLRMGRVPPLLHRHLKNSCLRQLTLTPVILCIISVEINSAYCGINALVTYILAAFQTCIVMPMASPRSLLLQNSTSVPSAFKRNFVKLLMVILILVTLRNAIKVSQLTLASLYNALRK